MAHAPDVHLHLLMTLDPVHVGTGGYRLGRVDNSIVREPGTNVPKIPGTALHGAIRQYAAHRYGKPQCAGQKDHCARPTCPICYTFGSIAGDRANAGVVAISDARIVLFPVYSMFGPVWVTTPERLKNSELMDERNDSLNIEEDKAIWSNRLTSENHINCINLGWLMVEGNADSFNLNDRHIPDQIKHRIVVVSERLFNHIVNSNLEVRTSVSINPDTGAAEEGALFTYEAIPRATVLWTEIVVSDFKGNFPSKQKWQQEIKKRKLSEDLTECQNLPPIMPDNDLPIERVLRELGYIGNRPASDSNDERKNEYWKMVVHSCQQLKQVVENSFLNWDKPLDVITMGLQWAEHLGIGGMGTRGFGRVRLLSQSKNHETTNKDTENPQQ